MRTYALYQVVGVRQDESGWIVLWGFLNKEFPFIEPTSELLALCRRIIGSSSVNAIGNTIYGATRSIWDYARRDYRT